MAILGLIGTENYSTERYKSARRSVFYDYPNGAAPLTGITSLLKEETCSDPEFEWYEKRLPEQRTITAEISGGKGPFSGSGATTEAWGTTLRTGGAGIDAGGATVPGNQITMKVADTTQIRPGHVLELKDAAITGGSTARVLLLVCRVAYLGAGYLDCKWLTTTTAGLINNAAATNTGISVLVVGSAYMQGYAGTDNAVYNLPVKFTNYCQIFRTGFSITGTSAKTAAKFDKSGIYDERAKEASVSHMIEMEKGFLFGQMTKFLTTSSGEYTNLPTYTTGGILWYLEQWEKANSDYRGGSGAAAVTLDTDDNKRIIELSTGQMSEKLFDGYMERIFRSVKNRANELLVFCGSGALSIMNQLYKSKGVLNASLPMTETYGMDVVAHRCPFGTIYYKTHPLFSQNPWMRNWMLFMDTGNLIYRYVSGRDTDILEERQPNNADYRMDEWLTECGLEVRFPESFMLIKNVVDYVP